MTTEVVEEDGHLNRFEPHAAVGRFAGIPACLGSAATAGVLGKVAITWSTTSLSPRLIVVDCNYRASC